ncbi:MAG: hypothetical protein Q9198_001346 [Flavoplaca austrocitrina]
MAGSLRVATCDADRWATASNDVQASRLCCLLRFNREGASSYLESGAVVAEPAFAR